MAILDHEHRRTLMNGSRVLARHLGSEEATLTVETETKSGSLGILSVGPAFTYEHGRRRSRVRVGFASQVCEGCSLEVYLDLDQATALSETLAVLLESHKGKMS